MLMLRARASEIMELFTPQLVADHVSENHLSIDDHIRGIPSEQFRHRRDR